METAKTKDRREREGFFEKYCQGEGIDIGGWDDPLLPNIVNYDKVNNETYDATYVKEINDNTYDFVYSSHCLEDIEYPATALMNWYRILKPGGYLILYLPHRDLYERKRSLPSIGNRFHKYYFLIDRNEFPCTLGIIPLINSCLFNYDIIYVKKCDENYNYEFVKADWSQDGYVGYATGEFSIEIVLQKHPNYMYLEEYIKLNIP
jgi:SAM-dependent methyltransferase